MASLSSMIWTFPCLPLSPLIWFGFPLLEIRSSPKLTPVIFCFGQNDLITMISKHIMSTTLCNVCFAALILCLPFSAHMESQASSPVRSQPKVHPTKASGQRKSCKFMVSRFFCTLLFLFFFVYSASWKYRIRSPLLRLAWKISALISWNFLSIYLLALLFGWNKSNLSW